MFELQLACRAPLQVQGFRELFGDNCEGVISWLNGASYYTAFTEGWALYAENPLIAEETDTYDNDPLQLYGMLKWQIWRALRLMMDTGLHYKGLLSNPFMLRASKFKLSKIPKFHFWKIKKNRQFYRKALIDSFRHLNVFLLLLLLFCFPQIQKLEPRCTA